MADDDFKRLVDELAGILGRLDTEIGKFEELKRRFERAQSHVEGYPTRAVISTLTKMNRDLMALRQSRINWSAELEQAKANLGDDTGAAVEKG